MSKAGKVLFVFSWVAFFLLGAARLVYGGWHDSFWVPLALWLGLFAGFIWVDRRFLRDLLAMRTTKHGMNMGALIVIALVALVCLNFLASRYEKKFDWTMDKFNSLSEQSIKAAQALKADTELILVYKKDEQNPNPDRIAGALAEMYRNASSQIRFSAYDGLVRPDMAKKIDFTFGPYAFYAVQGDKKAKIDPLSEEGITRALIKLGREKKKTIYFSRGHGELLLDDKDASGLSTLKSDLDVTYEVKSFALFETGYKVPDDADAVAVIGPKQQYLENELQALRDYAKRGGHLLIAIDPGMKHNLALLTKFFGVEFDNDYVLDLRARAFKNAPTLVLGSDFPKGSEITGAIVQTGNAFALFDLVASLKKSPDAPVGFEIAPLVRADQSTATVAELSERIEYKANGPHTVAMSIKGKLANDGKEMMAVIVGDSDFISNRLILNNLNRDLIGNSFAWLTNDKDLITIRPREPRGTKLVMPSGTYVLWGLVMLMIPVSLFITAFTFWWRRRTA